MSSRLQVDLGNARGALSEEIRSLRDVLRNEQDTSEGLSKTAQRLEVDMGNVRAALAEESRALREGVREVVRAERESLESQLNMLREQVNSAAHSAEAHRALLETEKVRASTEIQIGEVKTFTQAFVREQNQALSQKHEEAIAKTLKEVGLLRREAMDRIDSLSYEEQQQRSAVEERITSLATRNAELEWESRFRILAADIEDAKLGCKQYSDTLVAELRSAQTALRKDLTEEVTGAR